MYGLMFLSAFQQEVMLQTLLAILKLDALSHKKKWGENVESLEQGLKLDNSWAEHCSFFCILLGQASWARNLCVHRACAKKGPQLI